MSWESRSSVAYDESTSMGRGESHPLWLRHGKQKINQVIVSFTKVNSTASQEDNGKLYIAFFIYLFFETGSHYVVRATGSHYVVQASLKLTVVFLSQLPKLWDYSLHHHDCHMYHLLNITVH